MLSVAMMKRDTGKNSFTQSNIYSVARELSRLIKPAAICSAVTAVALILAVLLIVSDSAEYIPAVTVYTAVAVFAVTMITVATRGMVSDITGAFSFPRPFLSALIKLTASAAASFMSAALLAACGFALTAVSGAAADLYSVSALAVCFFSLTLYVSMICLTAASCVDPAKKNQRRAAIMDGVLLYTGGFLIFIVAAFIVSGIPLGSDALEELTGSGINPSAPLLLSLIYLGVTFLRVSYLYYITGRRLRRVHKKK